MISTEFFQPWYQREGEAVCPHVATMCAASLRSPARMLQLRLELHMQTDATAADRWDIHARPQTYTHIHTREGRLIHAPPCLSLLRLRTGEGAAMRQQATPSPGKRLRGDVMTRVLSTFLSHRKTFWFGKDLHHIHYIKDSVATVCTQIKINE